MRKTPLLRRTPLKARRPLSSSEKKPKAAVRERKAARPRSTTLTERLDNVFSLYVRLRDAMDGGMTRCISCGRIFPFSAMQAGHFFTRHHMATRWDEDNVHSQCAECNCSKGGNLEAYRASLERKIGRERLEELSRRHAETRRWSDDELRTMIRHYTEQVALLRKEKGIKK